MSRIRLILMSLAALLAVSAVASASAWAVSPETRYFVGGSEVKGEETFGVTGTSGTSKLEGEILSTKVVIVCLNDRTSGTENLIEKEGKSKGEITFENCSIEGQGTCVVPPIKFKVKDKLLSGAEDLFEPASGKLFVEIRIEVCALKGTYPVEGTQICNLPGGETEAVEHLIECTPTGSKLELGKKPAKFTSTEHVRLTSNKKWRSK
jgi:hypothetical protein